jgi:hypothetical protein
VRSTRRGRADMRSAARSSRRALAAAWPRLGPRSRSGSREPSCCSSSPGFHTPTDIVGGITARDGRRDRRRPGGEVRASWARVGLRRTRARA